MEDALTAGLRAWRDAERRMADATNGDVSILAREVVELRAEYHRLLADRAAATQRESDLARTSADAH